MARLKVTTKRLVDETVEAVSALAELHARIARNPEYASDLPHAKDALAEKLLDLLGDA